MFTGLVVAAIGSATAGVFAIQRKSFLRKVRSIHHLSPEVERELDVVGQLHLPYPRGVFSPQIPLGDLAAIYLNSRENRRAVNFVRLEPGAPDLHLVMFQVDQMHEKVKNCAIASILERVTIRLNPETHSVSSRSLLWAYGEQQALIEAVSEYCSPSDRSYLLTRT